MVALVAGARAALAAPAAATQVASPAPAALPARPPSPEHHLPEPPPLPPRPDDTPRMAGAWLAAAGAALAGVAGTRYSYLALAPMPAAAGFLVCAIGGSGLYEGPCRAPIVGAYVGALALGPGALAGAMFCGTSVASGSDCLRAVLVGMAIAYVVGVPTGAVVGWNMAKTVHRGRVAAGAPAPLVVASPPPSLAFKAAAIPAAWLTVPLFECAF